MADTKTIYLKVTYHPADWPDTKQLVDEVQSTLEFDGGRGVEVVHFASEIEPRPTTQGDGDPRPIAAAEGDHDFRNFHGDGEGYNTLPEVGGCGAVGGQR